MSFGGQTVTFVAITDGTLDDNGIPAKVRTEVEVSGCRFRPLSATEALELTDLSTEVWKCTAPPVEAVTSAKSIDEVKCDDNTYQVLVGPRAFTDMGGTPFKVTVLAQRQVG